VSLARRRGRRIFHNMPEDRPLITPRSPSYERAREEEKHPSPPGDAQVIAVLGRLVEAEHEATRAWTDEGAKEELRRQGARLSRLSEMITRLGGSPPRPEEGRSLLAAGKTAGALAEEYRRAQADAALSPEQREALAKLLQS
jgi:hypothetical protein